MAPSDERNVTIDLPVEDVIPKTNVAVAVNYELQLVEQYLIRERKRSKLNDHPDTVPNSAHILSPDRPRPLDGSDTLTLNHSPRTVCMNTISCANGVSNEENDTPNSQGEHFSSNAYDSSNEGKCHFEILDETKRRSTRERNRREVHLARVRVRYDMQLVPPVKRNKAFLRRFPIWWLNDAEQARHVNRLLNSSDLAQTFSPDFPFLEDSSIVWVPFKRTDWEDCINEMTAVCTSASIRRYNLGYDGSSSRIFHPPLSREYIKDRINIDDPLEGYQIRSKNGGWLQGFVMYTNFTTWTHSFKWDSRHPMSGIAELRTDGSNSSKVDFDGVLSDELEAQPRTGDPQGTGIIFSTIAEIGLVGGIGCGEYLLRMVIDSINEKKQYGYVVLQATELSKTFYEEFGFVRVGSICRYGKGLLPPEENTPISGYRHWTHANESKQSLRKHGGPSYMMCLKLPSYNSRFDPNESTLLSEMLKFKVQIKPKIELLGCSRQVRRNMSFSAESSGNEGSPRNSRVVTTRKSSFLKRNSPERSLDIVTRSPELLYTPNKSIMSNTSTNVSNMDSSSNLSTTSNGRVETNLKRRRVDLRSESMLEDKVNMISHEDGIVKDRSQSKAELSSSYVHKQYHSVWLAVPPKPVTVVSRNPPKDRSSDLSNQSSTQQKSISTVSKPLKSLQLSFCPTNKSKENSNDQMSSERNKSKVSEPSKSTSELNERSYHSIRGPDGKFKGLEIGSGKNSTPKKSKANSPVQIAEVNLKKHNPVNRAALMKQKVKSYPRSRVHYYNRVVKPKNGPSQYFFVLNFDEENDLILLVPMQARGKLSGKREGRPRYQALVGDTDYNFITVPAQEYTVVNSAMVMKTPIVASEAWDIEDD